MRDFKFCSTCVISSDYSISKGSTPTIFITCPECGQKTLPFAYKEDSFFKVSEYFLFIAMMFGIIKIFF